MVTAEQMRRIESRLFAAGMPVAALMEKVGGLIACRVQALYPQEQFTQVGVLVGPGHNGGDALVVARELWFQGYEIRVFRPLPRSKDLTQQHAQYATSLGIPFVEQGQDLKSCDLLIDGLFGFGLARSLTGDIAVLIEQVNTGSQPVLSIDLPSGLHTDTGAVLGTAVQARQTLCLGLWKLGLLQESALAYVGSAELIDFDVPWADIIAILGDQPQFRRITPTQAIAALPLPRPLTTHKYDQGHLLLIGGSQRYAGSIVLAGLGAQAAGVGMLSIAVPASLKPLLISRLPDALIIACPETDSGAIAQLPAEVPLSHYDVIAYGPGVTTETSSILTQVIASDRPLVLDADGLNLLSQLETIVALRSRAAMTILTPHPGEFKRLFPHLASQLHEPAQAAQAAATSTGAIVVLKGARVAIASPENTVWINPESTPALARGGSGDVLTGLMGSLLAPVCRQSAGTPDTVVASAVWWHALAGRWAAQQCTELGVDALTLTQYLRSALSHQLLNRPLETHSCLALSHWTPELNSLYS